MIRDQGHRTLIKGPFFAEKVDRAKTPSGVCVPDTHSWDKELAWFEPSSIGPDVDNATCKYGGDPNVPGRLDEITYLLERCHSGNDWPWRVAADPQTATPELL